MGQIPDDLRRFQEEWLAKNGGANKIDAGVKSVTPRTWRAEIVDLHGGRPDTRNRPTPTIAEVRPVHAPNQTFLVTVSSKIGGDPLQIGNVYEFKAFKYTPGREYEFVGPDRTYQSQFKMDTPPKHVPGASVPPPPGL